MKPQTLIFGTDDLYNILAPYYEKAVKNGEIEIVAYGVVSGNNVSFYREYCPLGGNIPINTTDFTFNLAILSAKEYLFSYRQTLLDFGIPAENILDGRVFLIPGLDFSRFLREGEVWGVIDNPLITDTSRTIYPHAYTHPGKKFGMSIGRKSYIESAVIDGVGLVSIGHFSSIANNVHFRLGQNNGHNYHHVCSYDIDHWDWKPDNGFSTKETEDCLIRIGSDTWIGSYSILKSNNPKRPLTIGDGAVIAADSVVIEDVPPYAIVGGNPAKIIKYRFTSDIIDAMLRIRWWDWPLEKIHANFAYFSNPSTFVKQFN